MCEYCGCGEGPRESSFQSVAVILPLADEAELDALEVYASDEREAEEES